VNGRDQGTREVCKIINSGTDYQSKILIFNYLFIRKQQITSSYPQQLLIAFRKNNTVFSKYELCLA